MQEMPLCSVWESYFRVKLTFFASSLPFFDTTALNADATILNLWSNDLEEVLSLRTW